MAGPLAMVLLRLRRQVALHGSAVVVDGRAVGFLGHSGRGKSTTAAALALRGWPLLAEDVLALSRHESGVRVAPGHTHVRLWMDSAHALFGDAQTLPDLVPGELDKKVVDFEARQAAVQTACPLGALFLLEPRQDGEAAPFLERVAPATAVPSLNALIHATEILANDDIRRSEFSMLSHIARTVPIYRLVPHASWDRLDAMADLILSSVRVHAE